MAFENNQQDAFNLRNDTESLKRLEAELDKATTAIGAAEVAAEDAKAYDILITDDYVGGKEIPADAGGPIKMVFPSTEYPELNDKYDMYAWQWYVSEIEFVK